MISILILTKNEENDIVGCVKSVNWSDDIHVFDSYSSDDTIEIAKSLGAKTYQRQFDGYASQRNAAFDTISFKYDWIFILDADERVPGGLEESLFNELSALASDVSALRLRRKDYLMGRWLKYSQISPYFIRIVKKNRARYHREINEVLEVDGLIKDTELSFDHYPFSKGMKHWMNKHNVYSSMEAERWIEEHKGDYRFSVRKAFFSKDFNEKRFHQKGIFYKMPGRPLIKWIYLMFWRRSFLDGKAGITYATLQTIYEYLIVLKTRELLRQDH